jgi:hypothetical protein
MVQFQLGDYINNVYDMDEGQIEKVQEKIDEADRPILAGQEFRMRLPEWLQKSWYFKFLEIYGLPQDEKYAPPIDDKYALDMLKDYLISEKWYPKCSNDLWRETENFCVVTEILSRYSRRFRKERRKYKKYLLRKKLREKYLNGDI